MISKTISKIFTTDVKSVLTTDRLADTVALMEREGVSCVPVLDGKKPCGILTERDIVRAANERMDFASTAIGDIMISPVITVERSVDDLDIFEIYELMASNEIRHLTAVDEAGDIVGVVTQTDLIRWLNPEYFVSLKEVGKIMTPDVVTLTEDGSLVKAVSLMASAFISCVIIVSEAVPIGIITERDITRLAAKGVEFDENDVSRYMSSPVETVTVGCKLQDAVALMMEKGVRRLVVVDSDGLLTGVVTQFDVIKGLESEYVKALKAKVGETEGRLREVVRQLDEKSTYLDNILRSTTDEAIVTCSPDMTINYINPVAESFYNLPASEAIGMRIDEIHKRENVNPERVEETMSEVRKTGRSSYMINNGEGEDRQVLDVRISTIINKKGVPIGFGHFARDVTEITNAGEALRQSEARYRSLIDNIDMGITLIGSDYRILMANSFQHKLFERRPGYFVGKNCFEEFERCDGVCSYCPGTAAMETGRAAEVETEATLKDGRTVSVHIKAFPVMDESGKASGFIEVVQDITKRKDVEAERENMIGALMDAFERIKMLHGLIPICSYCKKVRDDDGYWSKVETYIEAHSDAHFTHSICSDCGDRLKEGELEEI